MPSPVSNNPTNIQIQPRNGKTILTHGKTQATPKGNAIIDTVNGLGGDHIALKRPEGKNPQVLTFKGDRGDFFTSQPPLNRKEFKYDPNTKLYQGVRKDFKFNIDENLYNSIPALNWGPAI